MKRLFSTVLAIGVAVGSGLASLASAEASHGGHAAVVLESLASQIEDYRGDTGVYPDAPLVTAALDGILDPWGHAIRYFRVPSAAGGGFFLVSYGADGSPGGSGDAADLVIYRVAP